MFIKAHQAEFNVTSMCRVLGMHRSGYYAWVSAAQSPRTIANEQLLAEIKAFYLQSGGVYGSPRIYRDCKAAGLICSENRVARLMHRAHSLPCAVTAKPDTYLASQRLLALTDHAKSLLQKYQTKLG